MYQDSHRKMTHKKCSAMFMVASRRGASHIRRTRFYLVYQIAPRLTIWQNLADRRVTDAWEELSWIKQYNLTSLSLRTAKF